MTGDTIKEMFSKINIWKRGDERAPHKPLLLLLALGNVQARNQWLPYRCVKDKLGQLLLEFGPPRTTKVIDPFYRLTNDGLWMLSLDGLPLKDSVFFEHNVAAGFTDEVYSVLVNDSRLVKALAEDLLHDHFPESLHEDILTAVGLNLSFTQRAARDPRFRQRVLQAYEYSCAVCGFNVWLGNAPIALDAAHIKWYQSGGPDTERNGLALCSMHHKLFDRGAFSLRYSEGNFMVKVAQQAHGTSGFDEWLLRYHDRNIRQPQSPAYYPTTTFTDWHWREVFREPSRYSSGG